MIKLNRIKSLLHSLFTFKSFRLSGVLVWLFCIVLFIPSCTKIAVPAPSADRALLINFSASSITINMVDSAIVILKRKGYVTEYLLHFEKNNADLEANMESFREGEWTADVYVYSKMYPDGKKRVYVQKKSFNILNNVKKIEMAAPKGSFNDSWKTRVIFSNPGQDIFIFVPLDNADPYFGALVKNKKWDYVYIERYAYEKNGETSKVIGAAGWDCDGDCFANSKIINNITAFAAFSESVNGKNWNSGKIRVVVADYQTQEDITLIYSYNK